MGNQEQANTDIGEMLRSANKVTINKCKKKFKEKEKYLAKLQKSKEDTNPKKQQVKGNKKNKLKQNQTGGNNTTKLPPIEHDYATPQHTQTELTSAQKKPSRSILPDRDRSTHPNTTRRQHIRGRHRTIRRGGKDRGREDTTTKQQNRLGEQPPYTR